MSEVAADAWSGIRTPDQRLRVFVSSTLAELAAERAAVRAAIERLHLSPVMFELGARPHPPRALYRSYLAQSHVFVGLYWQSYGWVAPGEDVSGLEDEYRLASSLPQLLYVKEPAPDRQPRLRELLARLSADDRASYTRFSTPEELARLVEDDLAVLLTERFERGSGGAADRPVPVARRDSAPPVPLTRTVGRDREIATLTALLTEQRLRLVTVTGPGGVGKSRLALEVAARARGAFVDGVHLVPLEPVADAGSVLRSVADRLAVGGEGLRELPELLVDHLAECRMLLLLDNFEHVLAAAPAVAALLDRCPGVQALVTSRSPLRLRGEHEIPLAPLQVPAAVHAASPDGAADSTAVQLFVQRARAVRPSFELTAADLPAVAELMRRLDGLPLAIELAAARIRLLPPAALLERLERQLDVLSTGAVDLPARQRTLRAAIEWSYRLLAPAEQQLLDRLGVFAGGATLEAVEAVCGDADVDVLETLSSLVEKSLVMAAATGEQPRVQLLYTVRAYARERLAEHDEEADVADRHADWFLQRATTVDLVRHQDAHERFDGLLAESDDIRSAMERVLREEDVARTAAFATATWLWFWLTGRLAGVRAWYEAAALLAERPDAAPHDQARLLGALGQIRGLMGDPEGSVAVAQRALQLFEQVGDERRAATCHLSLSSALPHLGRMQEAYDHAMAAWRIGERVSAPAIVGYASSMVGTCRLVAGDLEQARAAYGSQHEAGRASGFAILEAQALGQLAHVDAVEGRPRDAWLRLEEAATLLLSTHSREGLSYWLETAAAACLASNDPAGALRALAAGDQLRATLHTGIWPLLRQLHDTAMSDCARRLGSRATATAAQGRSADPEALMERLLAEHGRRDGGHVGGGT